LLITSPKEYPDYDLYYPYYVPLNGLDVKMVNGTIQHNGISEDIAQQVRNHIAITIYHTILNIQYTYIYIVGEDLNFMMLKLLETILG